MAVIRYIADLHFGDENIIAYDNRPFLNVSEMNEVLIERWNRVSGTSVWEARKTGPGFWTV